MAGRYSLTTEGQEEGQDLRQPEEKIGEALREITKDMTLYEGVRLTQVLEAVYAQGKKDGARETFEALDKDLADMRRAIPHRTPGRPKRTKQ